MPGSTLDPAARKEITDELRAAAGEGDLPRLLQGLARWDIFWKPASGGNSGGPSQHNRPVSRLPFEFQHVLSAAAAGGHVEVVEYLLDERGLEISPPAIRGATLRKRSEVFRLFMDRGWDINAPVAGGNTCSVLSEFIWREEHVRWLLQRGADPYMVSAGGNNDIPSKAGRYAPVNVFRTLGEFGVDFSKTNALHAAAGSHVRGRIEVMTYLLDEAGVPINQVEYGWDERNPNAWRDLGHGTALHSAAWGKRVENARFLIQRGADRRLKDPNGRLAFDIAREYGFDEGVELLRV